MSEDKLSIKNEMSCFDRKDRKFFDSLTEEEKKKFSPYLMIRWGSSVSGDPVVQSYYLISCNERLNKHFFDVNTTQHKKLQWLLATTVSPGMGVKYHQWIAPKKKETDNKSVKFLRELYPHLKNDDLKLMADINGKEELKKYAHGLGWTDKEIKKDL